MVETLKAEIDEASQHLPKDVQRRFFSRLVPGHQLEKVLFEPPDIDWNAPLTLKEEVELRNRLRAQEYFLAHDERCSAELIDAMSTVFQMLAGELPEMKTENRALFIVPLVDLFESPGDIIQDIMPSYRKIGIEISVFSRSYGSASTQTFAQPQTLFPTPSTKSLLRGRRIASFLRPSLRRHTSPARPSMTSSSSLFRSPFHARYISATCMCAVAVAQVNRNGSRR